MKCVRVKTRIERKYPQLPRYVVVPARIAEAWNLAGTTTITGTVNGVDLGRRGLKNWGDGKRWFFELPELVCQKARVDTDDEVLVEFAPVEDVIPAELQALLVGNRDFASEWARLTPGRKRQIAEWVAGAKQPATRARRASSLVSGRRP